MKSNSRHDRVLLAPAALAGAFVVAAIVLGGGGTPAPRAELALEVLGAITLLFMLFAASWRTRPVPGAIYVLAGVTAILPILHLVPLPPSLWQSLPGRETEIAALTLIGAQNDWMPLSLVPSATLASLLSLGPPLLVLLMTAKLSADERAGLLPLVAWSGLAAFMLGVLQVTSGSERFYLYADSSAGWLTGFQAGRNLAADMLTIAMLAWAAIQPMRIFGAAGRFVGAAGIALLALGVLFTGSRAGIAIMVIVLPLAFHLAGTFRAIPRRKLLFAVAGFFLSAVGAVMALLTSPAARRSLERLDSLESIRTDIWADAWAAALAYWPAGGGMGGFISLFMPFERLEVLDGLRTNRAHNDYLELLIEAGAPGMVLLAMAIAVIGWLAWRALRAGGHASRQITFALGTIGVVAAHSLVDYPLRSMSIACLFAMAVAMLCPALSPEFRKGRST
ncbi:O-antigen ligase family protein [Croceicoccus ponticola]|nr:O-antigen ligase family protein [Croceicoccus ponticola]